MFILVNIAMIARHVQTVGLDPLRPAVSGELPPVRLLHLLLSHPGLRLPRHSGKLLLPRAPAPGGGGGWVKTKLNTSTKHAFHFILTIIGVGVVGGWSLFTFDSHVSQVGRPRLLSIPWI